MTKTVLIRIPVLVDNHGRWAANGWHNDGGPMNPTEVDWEFMDECIDLENPTQATRRVWVTAAVPLPEASEAEVSAVNVQDA